MAESTRELRYRFEQAGPARQRRMLASSEPMRYGAPLPRITRLMALAVYWDDRLRQCLELDGGTLARLGRVSRSRITQILNLLQLAPDIQERLLRLPPLETGREPITEKSIRQLASDYDWERQRERFEALMCRRAKQEQGSVCRN